MNSRTHRWLLFKLMLLFFTTVFCCIQGIAQNTYLDSLKNVLQQKNLPDTARIDNMIIMGDRLGYANKDEAMDYLTGALQLAKSKHLFLRTGDALTGIGQAYYRSDNLDSCLYYLKLADPFFNRSNSPEAVGRRIGSKMNMATVMRTMGNPDTAITIYLQGIDAIQQSDFPGKPIKLITAYLNIGLVYNEMNQWEKALFYHRKGLGMVTAETSSDIRVHYLRLHRIHDFIELKQYDSARYYLEKEEPLFKKINQPDIYSQVYSNWGMYYMNTGNEAKALEAFDKAYHYAIDSKNEFRQEGMLGRMASIYRNRKDYKKSILLFEQAFELSHKIKDKPSEMNYLKNLSSLYALANNDHKSVIYFQKYVHLNDSLNESESKKKINEIENKYQAEKKEIVIRSLQKDNQLQKAALKQKQTFNIALLGGCALLILLAGLLYKNFKNKNHILLQKEKLHMQQMNQMENERKLVAVQSVIKGQEEERSRLARDLHDGVGGLLSGVKLSMSTMKGNVFLSEENAETFNNVISQLDRSIAELRRVSHNMMPEVLVKFGLKEALENYCENLNLASDNAPVAEKINVKLQTYGMDERLEQNTEIIVYRIIQELLNNVNKHARAKNVLIQLIHKDDHFNLTVEDDGKGFNINDPNFKAGAGLANIKARAEYLNGTVDIVSKKNEGTSVHIAITRNDISQNVKNDIS